MILLRSFALHTPARIPFRIMAGDGFPARQLHGESYWALRALLDEMRDEPDQDGLLRFIEAALRDRENRMRGDAGAA